MILMVDSFYCNIFTLPGLMYWMFVLIFYNISLFCLFGLLAALWYVAYRTIGKIINKKMIKVWLLNYIRHDIFLAHNVGLLSHEVPWESKLFLNLAYFVGLL